MISDHHYNNNDHRLRAQTDDAVVAAVHDVPPGSTD